MTREFYGFKHEFDKKNGPQFGEARYSSTASTSGYRKYSPAFLPPENTQSVSVCLLTTTVAGWCWCCPVTRALMAASLESRSTPPPAAALGLSLSFSFALAASLSFSRLSRSFPLSRSRSRSLSLVSRSLSLSRPPPRDGELQHGG